VASVALVLGMFWVLLVHGPSGSDVPVQSSPEQSASQKFFADYVQSDGRVVRTDQGGDTVSEGQADALRLAIGDDDADGFDRVWSWTRDNLQMSNGLFAWRWLDGAVVDAEPVADADLDVAVALAQASDRFGRSDLADEARRISSAVLDQETVEVGGRLVLVPGPWAVADQVVNPSYFSPCDDELLGFVTKDPRWLRLRDDSVALLGQQLATGLPSDWAVIDATGSLHAIAQPDDPTGPGRYGLDAARVPARLWGCDTGRALAGQLWPRLQHLPADGAYSAYALDGSPLDPRPHPLGLIAGALTAGAVGDRARAEELIGLASRLEDARPSYYGAAWLALAEDQLATISIEIPSDGTTEVSTDGSDPAPSDSATTTTTAPPAWWPTLPPDTSTVPGSLTVFPTDPAAIAGLPVPSPSPPHPTPLIPPPTTSPPTTVTPTTEPPTTVTPTTEPPTTEPPTTEPPTTEPPTTEPPTTEPPTTEPPSTEPPTTTTEPGGSL
jgi:hypothetical protein